MAKTVPLVRVVEGVVHKPRNQGRLADRLFAQEDDFVLSEWFDGVDCTHLNFSLKRRISNFEKVSSWVLSSAVLHFGGSSSARTTLGRRHPTLVVIQIRLPLSRRVAA